MLDFLIQISISLVSLNPAVNVLAMKEENLKLFVHVKVVIFLRRTSNMNLFEGLAVYIFILIFKNRVELILIGFLIGPLFL